MKLWLVRHAQPLIAPGVCYGASDVAADELATREAAERLAAVLPQGLVLRVSPLQRCQSLARQLQALRPDLVGATDARLAELDFGCWEGQRWDAIPPDEYERWTAAFGSYRFGGRESSQEFMARVAQSWDETRSQGLDAAWVAHAGVIRVTSLLQQGLRQIEHASQWPAEAPGFGQWRELAL